MRKFLITLVVAMTSVIGRPEEGMWIPMLLEQLNIRQMQDMGLRLTAEDIYSVNHSSLKDAIVQFGGGCTAEIVSAEGLILTNHHCGLGAIQRLSSTDHDYLTNGFWARNNQEELPAAGVTVTLLVRMEDVTDQVLRGTGPEMNQIARSLVISKNIAQIEKNSVKGTKLEAKIKAFYYGNQYYLFITQTFRDIRLVGAPPSAIGQFGGDTDNWMWPRHGGDFSVFRIYADSSNQPAAYSKNNLPYKPKSFIPVSLKGYKKGDFTFVFGYPGVTREYLTSWGVDLTANIENPVRIDLRQKRLDIYNEAMNSSPKVRIQYTAKHQGIANGWKKMIGETRGIKRLSGIQKKQEFESRFSEWANQAGNEKYRNLLPEIKKTYDEYRQTDMAGVYLSEAGQGIEIVRFAGGFRELVKSDADKTKKDEDVMKLAGKLLVSSKGFFKDFNKEVDQRVAMAMLKEMEINMNGPAKPSVVNWKKANSAPVYASGLYERSIFADSAKLYNFLERFKRGKAKNLQNDPGYQLAVSIYEKLETVVTPGLVLFNAKIDSLQRIYMAGQMDMQKDRRFYPDANSTLRVSYGKVDDYFPADAVHYNYFTTSEGILQKEDSTIYDYAVDTKLKNLFRQKDFGRYADADGTLHIAFTASNHTTGGNSGSPVLDASGNLIGINFDRNWEGTMSDLMYDPSQCRNITLDIRYCLFVIDKYAGADRLIKEMTIVK